MGGYGTCKCVTKSKIKILMHRSRKINLRTLLTDIGPKTLEINNGRLLNLIPTYFYTSVVLRLIKRMQLQIQNQGLGSLRLCCLDKYWRKRLRNNVVPRDKLNFIDSFCSFVTDRRSSLKICRGDSCKLR